VRGVHVHQDEAGGVLGQDVDAVQLGEGVAERRRAVRRRGWCRRRGGIRPGRGAGDESKYARLAESIASWLWRAVAGGQLRGAAELAGPVAKAGSIVAGAGGVAAGGETWPSGLPAAIPAPDSASARLRA
jgi:hypothetical protein